MCPKPPPRELITRYHTLQKQLASLPYNTSFPTAAARLAQANLLKAQLAQISLPGYQSASLKGESQKSFDVTTWVLSNLPQGNSILDVGSIIHRFPDSFQGRALRVTSIDLFSSDERVQNADFFEYENEQLFDAVVLSLCVNFVGCPRRRGLMISRAAGMLPQGGFVFLVLPGACVTNSRYVDEDIVKEVLGACGMETVEIGYEGKLFLAIARRREGVAMRIKGVGRRLVRGGKDRNNFSIIVEGQGTGEQKVMKKRLKRDGVAVRGGASKQRTKVKGRNMKGNNGVKKTTSNQRKRARKQAKRTARQGG